jgi:hypothetical protein
MPRRPCRPASLPGATCATSHVALRACERRHDRGPMSPHPGVKGDMHRRPCRSGRSPQATGRTVHVAFHKHPERHERQCIRGCMPSWSDIREHRCRLTRAGRATWALVQVALPGKVRRHSLECGIVRRRRQGDILFRWVASVLLYVSADNVNRKIAPRFSAPSAQTRPPCRRTIRCTVARPMPEPSKSWLEWSR